MTNTETTAAPERGRINRRTLLVIAAISVAVAVAITAAVIALGQSGHIDSLVTANRNLTNQVAGLRKTQNALSQADQTRQSANLANLGVCEETSTEQLNNYDPPVTVITDISISAPTINAGVASCPFGSFVPVAPQKG